MKIMNELLFDIDLYALSAIQKAVSDYKQIVQVKCSSENSQIRCSFFDFRYDVQLTMDEFANHVLMLSVKEEKNGEHD